MKIKKFKEYLKEKGVNLSEINTVNHAAMKRDAELASLQAAHPDDDLEDLCQRSGFKGGLQEFLGKPDKYRDQESGQMVFKHGKLRRPGGGNYIDTK